MPTDSHHLFDEVFDLPDSAYKRQFDELVGVDHVKGHLVKDACLLLEPKGLTEWSKKFHKKELFAVRAFKERPPLIIFSGDVGTGKTSLAESFGDTVARSTDLSIRVYRLGLVTRGRGAVGEMTHLISQAFAHVEAEARKGKGERGRHRHAIVLIIDEADALVSSRDTGQMHHEDRAGVNAVIRGVDVFTGASLPVLVVMCTNREDALDPAVMRRAASHFRFGRPNDEQRGFLFQRAFEGVFSDAELQKLATLTGSQDGRNYGFTYSDITTRLIPSILLAAYPDQAVDFDLAARVCEDTLPTRPFGQT